MHKGGHAGYADVGSAVKIEIRIEQPAATQDFQVIHVLRCAWQIRLLDHAPLLDRNALPAFFATMAQVVQQWINARGRNIRVRVQVTPYAEAGSGIMPRIQHMLEKMACGRRRCRRHSGVPLPVPLQIEQSRSEYGLDVISWALG